MQLRCARDSDVASLLALYASGELDDPLGIAGSLRCAEPGRWAIDALPLLGVHVGVVEGRPVGWAYVKPFHFKSAYSRSAEVGTSLCRDHRSARYARRLGDRATTEARQLGFHAAFWFAPAEREDLVGAAMTLGYEPVGRLPRERAGSGTDLLVLECLLGRQRNIP